MLTGATFAGSTFVLNQYELIENQVITNAFLVMTTLILDGIITKYRRSAYEAAAKDASDQLLAIDLFVNFLASNQYHAPECYKEDKFAIFRLIANNDNASIREAFYWTRSAILMLNYRVDYVMLMSVLQRITPELTKNASVNYAARKRDIGNAHAYTFFAILTNVAVMLAAGSIAYKANPTDDDYIVAAYLATNSLMKLPDLALTQRGLNFLGACSLFMNVIVQKYTSPIEMLKASVQQVEMTSLS